MDQLVEEVTDLIVQKRLFEAIQLVAAAWMDEYPKEELVITILPREDYAERKRIMEFAFLMLEREARDKVENTRANKHPE